MDMGASAVSAEVYKSAVGESAHVIAIIADLTSSAEH